MAKELTDCQRTAIVDRGRDVCVMAGAGSGKTLVLVERFISLVEEGVRPGEILAITFTERAAREMKVRIVKALEERGRKEERKEAEGAAISTIHSFLASVLREHAVATGVDPAFGILDEAEAARVQRMLLTQLFHRLQGRGDDRVTRVARQVSFDGARSPGDSLLGVYEKVRVMGWELDQEPVSEAISSHRRRLRDEIEGIYSEIRQAKARGRLTEAEEEVVSAVERLEPLLLAAAQGEGWDSATESLLWLDATLDLSPLRERRLKGALKKIRDEVAPLLAAEELAAGPRMAVIELLKEFDSEYSRWKGERSLLDFSDLELKARELISNNPGVMKAVASRFSHILVDEFQDTNHLQKGILDLIRRPGRFFAVGDVRQSIYGFRSAEVEVLQRFREEVRGNGGLEVPMAENWRSRPELLEFVNLLFKLPEGEALLPRKEFQPREGPHVELIVARAQNAGDGRRIEAAHVADRIGAIVEGGQFSYRDFALLFRSTPDIKVYERALTQRGVPLYVVSGRGLFNVREVVDLVSHLRVLYNPRDDIALAAVLRSPFLGLVDDALFWLTRICREGDGKKPLFYAVENAERSENLSADDKVRLASFWTSIMELRKLTGRLPIWKLILRVLKGTGFPCRTLMGPGGRRRYANLRKFMELARAFEPRGPAGLGEFLEMAREMEMREAREGEATLSVEKDDVVKLMTVHAAKGLEFPVVVIPDLTRGRPTKKPPVLFRPETGMAIMLKWGPKGMQTLKHRIASEIISRREGDEGLRLLYVAMTRAQERLILSSYEPKREQGNWLKLVLGAADDNPHVAMAIVEAEPSPVTSVVALSMWDRYREKISKAEPVEAQVPGSAEEKGRRLIAKIERPAPVPSKEDYVASATQVMHFVTCRRRFFFQHVLGLPVEIALPRGAGDADEYPALALGLIAHEVFREYKYRPGFPGLEELIVQVAGRTTGEIGPQEVALVSKWVRSFYNGPLGRVILSGGHLTHEASFMMPIEGLLIRGRIDLLHVVDGKATLIELKTDRVEGVEIEERVMNYRPQLLLYTLAVNALWGAPPAGAFIHFLHPDVVKEVDLGKEAMEEAQTMVARFREAVAQGDYHYTTGSHCYTCPYRGLNRC